MEDDLLVIENTKHNSKIRMTKINKLQLEIDKIQKDIFTQNGKLKIKKRIQKLQKKLNEIISTRRMEILKKKTSK